MITLLTILHVSVCVFLIVIVLLQHGKGADMGASFGGGSGQTVFGSEGPLPLLNKITTGGAIIFMVTSVALAYNSAHMTKGSVMKGVQTAPVSKPLTNKAPVEVPAPNQDQAPQNTKQNAAKSDAQFPGSVSDTSSMNNKKQPVQNSKETAKPSEVPSSADKTK